MATYHDLFNKSLNINVTTPLAATSFIPKFTAVGATQDGVISGVGTASCSLVNYIGLLTEDLLIGGYPKTQMSGVMSLIGSGYTPLTPGKVILTANDGVLTFTDANIYFNITDLPCICIGICLSETDIFLYPEPTGYDESAIGGVGVTTKSYGRNIVSGALGFEAGGTGATTLEGALQRLGISDVYQKPIGTAVGTLAAGDHTHEVSAIKATGITNGNIVVTNNDLLTAVPSSGIVLPIVGEITGDITGFPTRSDTSVTFNTGTREVTLAPLNGNACIFFKGTKIPLESTKTTTWSDTTGARYVVYDANDNTLKEVLGYPNTLNGEIFVAYVYWNSVDQLAPVLGDERHLSSRDTQWHYSQHKDVGAVWRSGGALTYVTNNANNCTLGVSTPLLLADEDLEHVINHSAAAVNDYEQNLTTGARLPVLWKNGVGVTETASVSTFPFLNFGGRACYNPVVANSGSMVTCPNNTYMNYWVVATNDTRQPIKLVMGRATFTNSEDTTSESITDLGIPLEELAVMYRIVLHINDTYTANAARAVINKIVKVGRVMITGGQPEISAISHDSLANRELSNQHPIASITGLSDALSAKVDTVVGKVLSTNDFTDIRRAQVDKLVNGVMPDLMILPTKEVTSMPDADTLYLWGEKTAGRMMPKIKGPSGIETMLQPFLGSNGIMLISPASGTAFSLLGCAAPTLVGTASTPTPTTGSNFLAASRRTTITSAATANSASDVRITTFPVYFGELFGSVKSGGFFAVFRTGISSNLTGQRQVIGLTSSTAALTTSLQPSALTNSIILGNDNADTNMQVMHNDGSGTCTKINLGSSFPAGASAANNIYELALFCEPNGSSVEYRVRNLTTGVTATGVLTTNLPSKTTMLYPRVYANNNGTAAAVANNVLRIYIETDN